MKQGTLPHNPFKKNGYDSISRDRDAILKEIETIFNLRDFAADTLAKNGTEANYISGTISDQNLNKNILPEITVVFAPETYLRVDTLNSPNCKPEKVAILTNKSHEIVF